MTTLQKAVATSVVTISLGVGIYAKHEASQLQDEVRQLQTTRTETMNEYLPYVDNEAQKVAIEKLKLRNEVRTGF